MQPDLGDVYLKIFKVYYLYLFVVYLMLPVLQRSNMRLPTAAVF